MMFGLVIVLMVWFALIALYGLYNFVLGYGPLVMLFGLVGFGFWFWVFRKVKRARLLKSLDNNDE